MKVDDFGGLCLTNAHLAFRPKGFSRRFAPQNDIDYALPQYHITTLGIVMPMDNDWPLINAGKAQEPIDS